MRVLGYILSQLDGQPKAIDTKRDNAQEQPDNELTEKLSARTVKADLLAVNDGMFRNPLMP